MNNEFLNTLYVAANLTIIVSVIALFIVSFFLSRSANRLRALIATCTILAIANLARVLILFEQESLNFTFYFSTAMFIIWIFFARMYKDQLIKMKP